MSKKDIYYYIDESGTLDSKCTKNDRFFIMGCCITYNPEEIRLELNNLRLSILENPYFAPNISKFKAEGFHATANHFDVRAKYYEILYRLNYRYYCIIIDKADDKYKDLISKGDNAYYHILYHLLIKRIIGHCNDNNIVILENYGSTSINLHQKSCEAVLKEIEKEASAVHPQISNISFCVSVHTKDDIVLSLVDYATYPINQMLLEKVPPKMEENISLLQPKIGLIHNLFAKKFYSRTKKVNFVEIKSGK